jgi:hypothetical protein
VTAILEPPFKPRSGTEHAEVDLPNARSSTVATNQEINPAETPLDPDETQTQPPLSGTVDDNDETDDEHWDENEAPERALSDKTDTRGEFRLDEREEDADDDSSVDDEDEDEDEDEVDSTK